MAYTQLPREALERSVVDLFERQVELDPHRSAIEHDGVRLTYGGLNSRANWIGHAILDERRGTAAAVAVLLDDTPTLAAAIVGTLKAGDYYLVLDPADPAGRLRTLLEDAEPALIVCSHTTRSLAADVAPGIPVLDLDAGSASDGPREGNPGLRIAPDALLNIMYTSGTTGRPKGVLQTQRNLVHAVYSSAARLPHTADERFGVLSPLNVGVGAAMLFGGLLTGATVLPFSVRRNGVAKMLEWLIEERITITYSLPSVIRNALLLLPRGIKLPDLHVLRVGGEPLLRSDLQLFRDHLLPGTNVQITMGTTETYVIAWSDLDPWREPTTAVMPVGVPEADGEIILVDEAGQPVAPGEVGEVVFRSPFLSPGYWKQPHATKAAFRTTADGRLEYRTGDLGRILSDGKLLHLGRKDSVAKIRGHLVSPTEVETSLRELESVATASVIAHTVNGRSRLIAYIVSSACTPADPRMLREQLSAKLPEHMVPSGFIFVDQLPLLPNGKVDFSRLPSPDAPGLTRSRPYVAARTPVESLLTGIWAEVLGQEVGVEDDFVEMGGDSLLAAQVLARVNTACQLDLPFSALFEAPTITALATIVGGHLAEHDPAYVDDLLAELEGMTDAEAQRTAER